ncbi:hypothetical protein [Luteimonas sp. MHLX1A]|uniref:hypothetical protein n=1 Tax=Alterluteimonas muca TaxID=2878684 RepID=UPI001E4B77A2|nr:hypothetical protein [Luteimonas sp. MHLX1A]MCD9046833.1 hypothetical protein [Luteimonas sp. MHLX1A]
MHHKHIIAVALVATLTACSDPKAPSEANFTAAFHQYLEEAPVERKSVCHEVPSYDPASKTVTWTDTDMGASTAAEPNPRSEAVQTLVDAGFFSEPRYEESQIAYGTRTVVTYALAPGKESAIVLAQGRNVFGSPMTRHVVCGGRLELQEVVRWTEPEAGSNESVVTYRVRYADVPAWVTDERLITFLGAQHGGSGEPFEVEKFAVLTNEGWRI